jgi:nicotinamide mononucleotide transporter
MTSIAAPRPPRLAARILRAMTPFQWAEVLAVTGFALYFAFTDHENPAWYVVTNAVAVIAGITCVVLCAGGKRAQYYWGFVNIAAYVAIAASARFYGEVMLNVLYYLPTQFIGLWLWSRHRAADTTRVRAKRMSPRTIVVTLAVTALVIWGYRELLVQLGGAATWLDAASTAFALIANALMVLRYREQWVLWIVVDIITVTMWIGAGDWTQTAMWSVYLINAVYGLIVWTRLERAAAAADTSATAGPAGASAGSAR